MSCNVIKLRKLDTAYVITILYKNGNTNVAVDTDEFYVEWRIKYSDFAKYKMNSIEDPARVYVSPEYQLNIDPNVTTTEGKVVVMYEPGQYDVVIKRKSSLFEVTEIKIPVIIEGNAVKSDQHG